MKKKGSLRETMPLTAAFIDGLREMCGKDEIDDIIRRGMRGEPVFYARENGVEIGTKIPRGKAVSWDPVTGVAFSVNGDSDDRMG